MMNLWGDREGEKGRATKADREREIRRENEDIIEEQRAYWDKWWSGGGGKGSRREKGQQGQTGDDRQ